MSVVSIIYIVDEIDLGVPIEETFVVETIVLV